MKAWQWKAILVLLCFAAIVGSYGYLAFWYFFKYKTDDLPNVSVLRNYDFTLTTIVRDDAGKVIDRFAVEDRVFLPFDQISENVIKAVVAAEDKNFWKERLIYGIDIAGIARALRDDILAGKTVAGGSTITQQTAKLVWLSNERSFKRKFREARLAFQMEKTLPKEVIFEVYVNLAYFGYGKYGIYTASEFYFGKTPDQLSLEEAAMLAGLIKWPYQFSPISRPKAAMARRNTILERIYRSSFIEAKEVEELKAKPLGLNVKSGEAEAPYLSSFVMDELHRFGYEKVVNQGLDVRLSLNSDFQKIADAALARGLLAYEERHKNRSVLYNIFSDYEMRSVTEFDSETWDGDIGIDSIVDALVLEVEREKALASIGKELIYIKRESLSKIKQGVDDLTKVFKAGDVVMLKITGVGNDNMFTSEVLQPEVQGAVVVLDTQTGGIKAIVGGRDFKVSKYNRAMQAERQAGSAFKPFVYGAYFEKYQNKDLQSIVLDSPICFKTGNPKKPKWCPKNYEEKSLPEFMGPIPVKTALARSRNVAAVRVANDTGIGNVIGLAHKLGITSELPGYLPTAIGAADVKVVDMARAFSVFFRNGIDAPYWFLKSVENRKNGLHDLEPKDLKRVLSPEAANKVLEGMRWVVLAGTARSAARELPFAVAGKTGTTNNFTDAWFVGGTPKYVVAVWVGFDRKAIPLVSRESAARETGGFTALPVFIDIMKEIYRNRPYNNFPEEIERNIIKQKTEPKPAPQTPQIVPDPKPDSEIVPPESEEFENNTTPE